MPSIIFIIAIIFLLLLGIGCFVSPQLLVKADQRDDPNAVAQVKKFGPMLIAFTIGAVLLMLKYKLT